MGNRYVLLRAKHSQKTTEIVAFIEDKQRFSNVRPSSFFLFFRYR